LLNQPFTEQGSLTEHTKITVQPIFAIIKGQEKVKVIKLEEETIKDELQLELSFFTKRKKNVKKTPINTKKRKEINEGTTAGLAGLLSKESTLVLLFFSSLLDPLSCFPFF